METHIAKRCEAAKRRGEVKKKARRKIDAPSNKMFGNCLLGLHCSQKVHAENRANARFLAVAGIQHGNPSTGYPQMLVDRLGIVFKLRSRCAVRRKANSGGLDSTE